MSKSYFIIAIRNIRRRKIFASINLLGMTMGITACLLIALYIIDEFSYDRFHANADRMYQVGLHEKFGERDVRRTSVCPPLADAMMAEIPEVESTVRMNPWLKLDIHYQEKSTTEYKVFFTESNFFDFFSFRFISGNAKTALKEPYSIVLTEKTARKLFGDENPLEKLVIIGEGEYKATYKVTGVAANCPSNSHFSFDVLLSAAGPDNYFKLNAWLNSGVYTYFLLRKNVSVADMEKKFENIVTKYVTPNCRNF